MEQSRDTFAAGSGVVEWNRDDQRLGAITGSVTYTQNGLPIPVTAMGQATRSLSGVVESGTWTFSVNLGGGVTETGSGTWSAQSVLSVQRRRTPGRLTARPRSTTTERSPPLRFRTR